VHGSGAHVAHRRAWRLQDRTGPTPDLARQ
jgi:hypothetical protein